MAEELENIEVPQPPKGDTYVSKVYKDLSDTYGAKNIIDYSEFSKKIATDKNYAKQVHTDMSSRYGEKNIIDFDGFYNNVKKKDTPQVLPNTSKPLSNGAATQKPTSTPLGLASSEHPIPIRDINIAKRNVESYFGGFDKVPTREMDWQIKRDWFNNKVGKLDNQALLDAHVSYSTDNDYFGRNETADNPIDKEIDRRIQTGLIKTPYKSAKEYVGSLINNEANKIVNESGELQTVAKTMSRFNAENKKVYRQDLAKVWSDVEAQSIAEKTAADQKISRKKALEDYNQKRKVEVEAFGTKNDITDDEYKTITDDFYVKPAIDAYAKKMGLDVSNFRYNPKDNTIIYNPQYQGDNKGFDEPTPFVYDEKTDQIRKKGDAWDMFGQGVKDHFKNVQTGTAISNAIENEGNKNKALHIAKEAEKERQNEDRFEAGKWGENVTGNLGQIGGEFSAFVHPITTGLTMTFSSAADNASRILADDTLTDEQKATAIAKTTKEATDAGLAEFLGFEAIGLARQLGKKATANNLLQQVASPTLRRDVNNLMSSAKTILYDIPKGGAKIGTLMGTMEALKTSNRIDAGVKDNFDGVSQSVIGGFQLEAMMGLPKLLKVGFRTLTEAKRAGLDKTNKDWYTKYNDAVSNSLFEIARAKEPIYVEIMGQLDMSPDTPETRLAKAKIKASRERYETLPDFLNDQQKKKAFHIMESRFSETNEAREIRQKAAENGNEHLESVAAMHEAKAKQYDKMLQKMVGDDAIAEPEFIIDGKDVDEVTFKAATNEPIDNKAIHVEQPSEQETLPTVTMGSEPKAKEVEIKPGVSVELPSEVERQKIKENEPITTQKGVEKIATVPIETKVSSSTESKVGETAQPTKEQGSVVDNPALPQKLELKRSGVISKEQMIKEGATGSLNKAFERYIPIEKIEGADPKNADWTDNEGNVKQFEKGQQIETPIEVIYDKETDKYLLQNGNHRLTQAELNGQKHIAAYIEPNKGSIGEAKLKNPDLEQKSESLLSKEQTTKAETPTPIVETPKVEQKLSESQQKQQDTNDLVDAVSSYNGIHKNKNSERAAALNIIKAKAKELGLSLAGGTKSRALELQSKNGNLVRKKELVTNKTQVENFDRKVYADRTNEAIDKIVEDPTLFIGLAVKGTDGKRLSQKQVETALKSIKEGKTNQAAKAIFDYVENAHNENGVHIEDVTTGQQANIPFDEYFEAIKEQPKFESIDEINQYINDNWLENEQDLEQFNHFINETQNEQGTNIGEVSETSTTTKNASNETNVGSEKTAGISEKKQQTTTVETDKERTIDGEKGNENIGDKKGSDGGKVPPVDEKVELKELDKLANNVPDSGKVTEYMSKDTIEKYTGETPTNDQRRGIQELEIALNHGEKIIEKAQEIYGKDYAEKTIDYIDNSSASVSNKALMYVSLENALGREKLANPERAAEITKQQALVYARSQAFARENSLALNYQKLRKIAKVGYDINKVTDSFFSADEKMARNDLSKAIEANPDEINKAAEDVELKSAADIEQLVKEGVEKEIAKVYEKMPSSLKKNADAAIAAIENFQKTKLRGKAYDATIGVPIAIIDAGMTTIKMAIKAGVKIADAIELGIEKIKERYGNDWAKEAEFRKDVTDAFANLKTEKSAAKDIVKDALIEKGFAREITVKGEKKKILDWKKLAGVAGTVGKISENVADVIKGKYSEKEIASIQKEFIDEYINLRTSVIEKAQNELARRNKKIISPEQKSAAKKLAELYTYGLFEAKADEFEHTLNRAMGADVSESAFNEAKDIAKGLETIYSSSFKGIKLTDVSAKAAVNKLEDRLRILLFKESKKQGNFALRAANMVRGYFDLQQTMILNNLKQAVENPLSGLQQVAIDNINSFSQGTITKDLAGQRRKMMKTVYRDMVLNGEIGYGKVESAFVTRTHIDDYVNSLSDNKLYHGIASVVTGKSTLNAMDAMYKQALTETKFVGNLVKVLTHETNAKRMSKDEAMKFVAEKLTGQTFKDAQKTASEIITKINKDAGSDIMPNTKESVDRFANDIVKASLEMGGNITTEQITAAYNAAYKAAGLGLGHEANNFLSSQIGAYTAKLESKINNAIQEKEWNRAAMLTAQSVVFRNVLNPFVGGGTNWLVLKFEKTGLGLVTGLGYKIGSSTKIDLSSDVGMKLLESRLYNQSRIKDQYMRGLVGGIASALTYGAFAGLTSTDDYRKWRGSNRWAARYLDVVTPEYLLGEMAVKDKKVKKYVASTLNKNDYFDASTKVMSAVDYAVKGDKEKMWGAIGEAVGSKVNTPLPWRLVKDGVVLYQGITGQDPYHGNYKASTGFMNGVFQGGAIEWLGYRPEPTKTSSNSSSGKGSKKGHKKSHKKTSDGE